jgi:hypothetical protein
MSAGCFSPTATPLKLVADPSETVIALALPAELGRRAAGSFGAQSPGVGGSDRDWTPG